MMNELLELLRQNARLTNAQLADMLGTTEAAVAAEIHRLEAKGIIKGYSAIINDELAKTSEVEAIIELRVTPQRDLGYDRIAERIYQYPEVKAINLMSGSYDFGITVEGRNIREVSQFVSEHLAAMESVIGTATHFVLKRYKYDGVICARPSKDEREVISL